MSRTSVMFIEYRSTSSGPWKWLCPLMPADEVCWSNDEPTHMVDINGNDLKVPYKKVYELSKQGTIRDMFNDDDVEFNGRGWPSDMSPELRDYIDKNTDQFDGIWGKSHATLSEISACIDAQKKKWETYKQEYISKKDNISIHEKLGYIIKFLAGSKDLEQLKYFCTELEHKENMGDESDEEYYDYLGEYNELIDDYVFAGSFINGITQIVDFCTNSWTDDTDIRLIYFTC